MRKARWQHQKPVGLLHSFAEYDSNIHQVSTQNIQIVCNEERFPYAVFMRSKSESDFGKRLAQARAEKKISGEALAKGLGTDGKDLKRAAVSGWETGKSSPNCQQLKLICQRLEKSADYMLFGNVGLTPQVMELASILQAIDEGEAKDKLLAYIQSFKKEQTRQIA